jgi:hypothetical protein
MANSQQRGLSGSLVWDAPKGYWYLSRASAWMAFALLWLSMALGLLITNRLARVWPGGPNAFDLHQHVSLLALAFSLFHALILLGDRYVGYSRWIEALETAVRLFGPGRVYSAMVAGVELEPEHGLTADEAGAIALRGAEDLLNRGIIPIYSLHWPSGGRERPDYQEKRPGHWAACHLITADDYPHIRAGEDDLAALAIRSTMSASVSLAPTTPGRALARWTCELMRPGIRYWPALKVKAPAPNLELDVKVVPAAVAAT